MKKILFLIQFFFLFVSCQTDMNPIVIEEPTSIKYDSVHVLHIKALLKENKGVLKDIEAEIGSDGSVVFRSPYITDVRSIKLRIETDGGGHIC